MVAIVKKMGVVWDGDKTFDINHRTSVLPLDGQVMSEQICGKN